jgi:predicted dehydrogenase
VHDSYAAVLDDPEVDAVALTVRSQRQGAMAAMALEAGKHVHAEVPAAHSIEDCWRIVRAAERTGLVYQLAEQTRYWSFVGEWRKAVAAGELGDISLCEAQYFHYLPEAMFADPVTGDPVHPDEAGPDARPTWAHRMPPIHYLPHSLSPMLKVLDDRVTEVVAMSTAPISRAHPTVAQPDLQTALMKTARGTILRMSTSFVQPHPETCWHWYQVIGTGGRLEWRRTDADSPRRWTAGTPAPIDESWTYERADAPPEATGSGHGDADYYTHIAFRDSVFGTAEPEMDVYQAMDTAAPAILAATSIAAGSGPQHVPDFRSGQQVVDG